jgi:hypothetical protein
MPICERDPWRFQYFEDVACPVDVNIPTDDIDCFAWFPRYRWAYEKLKIAQSQTLPCGMAGDMPTRFPVFAKPNINLKGMGLGSGVVSSPAAFEKLPPDHMWMPVFTGEHISTDCAIVNGEVRWVRHALGFPWHDGMFTHWVIETGQRVELESFLARWVVEHMAGYTGMMNFETIGGHIIEAHLRFADQWCDLYGRDWFDALVKLYAEGVWEHRDDRRFEGYSIPLFARHGVVPPHPPQALQTHIRGLHGISSLQITYHESKPGKAHSMPPGGFRLALVNCTDLKAGLSARNQLAEAFPGCEVMLPGGGGAV